MFRFDHAPTELGADLLNMATRQILVWLPPSIVITTPSFDPLK